MAINSAEVHDQQAVTARIKALPNDALIVDLLQTINHLSRWLTPIHDRTRLEVSAHRSEPSVKDVLISMRDTEALHYGRMYAIATEINPDLDRVPRPARSAAQQDVDRHSNALVILSELRRMRESSTSLLRALPDTAWQRGGFSRTERDWTIRDLANSLAVDDVAHLREIDRILNRSGARTGIAEVSRVSVDQLDQPFAGEIGRS